MSKTWSRLPSLYGYLLRQQTNELLVQSTEKSCLRSTFATHTGPEHDSTKLPHNPTMDKEPWQVQKAALKEKFGEQGWQPRKKLSPDAMEGIKHLHAQNPEQYSTKVLANEFEVSPEAIRRILKSNWRPSEKDQENRKQRWEKRGQSVWDRWAALGLKAPKKWREARGKTREEDSIMVKRRATPDIDTQPPVTTERPRRRGVPLSSRIL